MPFFTEKSGRDPLFLSYVGYYYIEKIFRGVENCLELIDILLSSEIQSTKN